MEIPSTSIYTYNNPDQPGSERVPVRTLDQNDFLKLVVAQMTNQNPLEPQKDTEFIAQMAQFSALEQSKSMEADLSQMRLDQSFLQANAMIGRVVELQQEDGALTSGLVSGIQVEEGTPKIVVNDQPYALNQVLMVEPAVANP
jgi:flagellar basal-body rod modification protein FlgD